MVNLTTIEYDRPVANFISQLNATGHVTHVKHKKSGVTFHHNGGGPNFSHQTILNIWKTRPASAHFDVDGNGDIAQYINAFEYAWACANTYGNQTTISIELANSTLAPGWHVSETTWKSGARLAAWLFLHIIGEAPTAKNIYAHHDWYPTACFGPYMDSVRSKLVREVQHQYAMFKSGNPTPAPSKQKETDVFDPTPTYSDKATRDVKTGWRLVRIGSLKNGDARFTVATGHRHGMASLYLRLSGLEPGKTVQVRAVDYEKKGGKWVGVKNYGISEHSTTTGDTFINRAQLVNIAKGRRLRWEINVPQDCKQKHAIARRELTK